MVALTVDKILSCVPIVGNEIVGQYVKHLVDGQYFVIIVAGLAVGKLSPAHILFDGQRISVYFQLCAFIYCDLLVDSLVDQAAD